MPSQGGEMLNEVQSRYGYLLKPIRDLFKNWEINIAAELEEYLNEMEQIKISFDGGQTVMNFAEAALLIQGSACIYSKKIRKTVKLLKPDDKLFYTLIDHHEILDYLEGIMSVGKSVREITALTETSLTAARRTYRITISECDFNRFNEAFNVEYLYSLVYQTLDLIASKRQLQQAPSVDDQGQDKDVSTQEQQQEFLLLDDIKESKNIDLKENSLQLEAPQLIPRTPVTLITFDDSKKGSTLLSLTGEVLGNRNDFKMNTCSIHLGSGALLLDMSSLHCVQSKAFQRSSQSTTLSQDNAAEHREMTESHAEIQSDVCNGLDELPGENTICPARDDMDDVDDLPCSPLGATEVQCETISHGVQLRERKEVLNSQKSVEKKIKDPWETLDPHDPNGGVEKIFKKGRPFKIPPSARDDKVSMKKRKRKSEEDSLVNEKLISIAEFCRLAYHSQAKKLPKNPLKTLVYHEFEYIYWNEFRRRQILERKHRKAIAAMGISEDQIKFELLSDDFDQNNNEPLENGFDDNAEMDDDFDNDDDDGGFHGNMNDIPTNGVEPMALEQSDELVVSSYEELVRKYVQGFLVQAQTYVQETDLSKRVKDWERKVVPKLENEDTHRPYDIHKYGENLLARFEDNPVKSFEEVVPSQEPWEVCRYFLASLQLANNNNVEIVKDKIDNAMDCMKLKLLHRTPAHEAISHYRAPSVLT